MTSKTVGEKWIETLEWEEVQEALAILEREPDLVPDRAGVVKALEERLGYLVREWLHEHPELVVHHPDGTWSLREDDSVVPFKPFLQRCNNATQKTPKDPPDGAA